MPNSTKLFLLGILTMFLTTGCQKSNDGSSGGGGSPAISAQTAVKIVSCWWAQDQVSLTETTYGDGSVVDTCVGLGSSSLPPSHGTNVKCGAGYPALTVSFDAYAQAPPYNPLGNITHTFTGGNPECVPSP